MEIIYKQVPSPELDHSGEFINYLDSTFEERHKKILQRMKEFNISSLIIYADKEHGGNFEYLTGFIPRFEEALQVLMQDGSSYLILGNENYNKVKYSRIKSVGIHCPLFSLPNQPMDGFQNFETYLSQIPFDETGKIGLVDWKLLTREFDEESTVTSIPHYIVDSLIDMLGRERLVNASHLYIDPGYGVRVTNNANEIAKYEFGASLASDALLEAYNTIEIGVSEFELGSALNKAGQNPTVVTIAAIGERFEGANLYPRSNKLKSGDKIALTVGYKGGLSSRTGYAVKSLIELESIDPHYYEEVVLPYYRAYLYWLQHIELGTVGGDFYEKFAKIYPQEVYGWNLNPGHLTADEEWLSSPFYQGSDRIIQSGMIFQVDFIPNQSGHQGVSAEATVAIADETLRNEIKNQYPELYNRFQKRRDYIESTLGISLAPHWLPMGSTLGYLRPFMLDHSTALVLK